MSNSLFLDCPTPAEIDAATAALMDIDGYTATEALMIAAVGMAADDVLAIALSVIHHDHRRSAPAMPEPGYPQGHAIADAEAAKTADIEAIAARELAAIRARP